MQIGPKQEIFCRLVASGKDFVDAYQEAGYFAKNRNSARAGASQLNRKYKERIEELRRQRDETIAAQVNQAFAEVGALEGGDAMTRIGRAKALVARRAKIYRIFEERSKDPVHNAFAGGSTGYLAINEKQVGSRTVKIAAVDVKVLEELRATEEQIARELGQWVEKRDDTMTVKSLADLPEEVLNEIIEQSEAEAQKAGIDLPTVN